MYKVQTHRKPSERQTTVTASSVNASPHTDRQTVLYFTSRRPSCELLLPANLTVKNMLILLAVIPSVTRGRGTEVGRRKREQMDTVGGDYSRIAMRGVSRKLTIRGGVSISHAPCLPCHVDLIDTTSCSNRCMLTLSCLVGHSIVISRRPTMRVSHWQIASHAINVPLLEQNRR